MSFIFLCHDLIKYVNIINSDVLISTVHIIVQNKFIVLKWSS